MVRQYHGTIEGIFWSFQDSYDPSHFKPNDFIQPKTYCVYYCCNCIVTDMEEKFCINCYINYENHYNNLDVNDKYYITDNFLGFECNSIIYTFDFNDLELIKEKLNELKTQLGEYIISNLNLQICDTYYIINDKLLDITNNNIKKLIARYCLGKHILYAIINYNTCSIKCDL